MEVFLAPAVAAQGDEGGKGARFGNAGHFLDVCQQMAVERLDGAGQGLGAVQQHAAQPLFRRAARDGFGGSEVVGI